MNPKADHHGDGLPDDVPGHFRVALEPVGENDRNFDDSHALAPQFVRELDLEAVTVRVDLVQVQGQQRTAPETLKPAGRISEGHPRDHLDEFRRDRSNQACWR